MPTSNTLVTRVGLTSPIIPGPFGGGYSASDLVAAVSNAGGLGSFGAHHLGPDSILETAAAIRARTSRPFALNLWASNHDPGGASPDPDAVRRVHDRLRPYFAELGFEPSAPTARQVHDVEAQAWAVVEARPAVFSVVFGVLSAEVIAACRRRGIAVVGAATTVDEARVLEAAGVYAIVATCFEAGGHRPSFLAAAEDSLHGTLALVPRIVDAVGVPVIAAGGIADARGVAAALALGAQAAQIGTAFLACDESGAPAIHRAQLLDAGARTTTVLSRVYTGRLARGIRNRLHDELQGTERLPYPAQGWVIGALREAAIAQGRADLISLWSGQAAGGLTHRHAADLMAALTAPPDTSDPGKAARRPSRTVATTSTDAPTPHHD
jgi:nitronate monooxygenase